MSEKEDRREYFKNYYKSLSDGKKEELRRKKREAYNEEIKNCPWFTIIIISQEHQITNNYLVFNLLAILVNEVSHVLSRTSNEGKQQIGFYSSYEVGKNSHF